MTDIHNALKRSVVADAVKKAIGQHKQGEGGLERWSETLQPIVNPWGMPEWAALRAEQLAAVGAFQAAVAAEFSGHALMNPAGSNTIVVVEAVSFIGTTTVQAWLELTVDTAIAATYTVVTNPSAARDRRFKGISGLTRATFRQGSDASNTFGARLEVQNFTAAGLASSFVNSLPVILRPGDDLVVMLQTVNIGAFVNWAWRERQAFPGELA